MGQMLARHPALARDRHSDNGKTRCGFNAGWTACLSEWPLIFLANYTSLNQRVPGSSPGAPTKQDQSLTNNAHQNGRLSWEAGLIRSDFGRGASEFRSLCALSFVSAPSRDEIQNSDRLVQVDYMPVVE